MMKGKGEYNRLYCFSPPVMLATFFIEIGFLVYVLFRYKLNPLSRLIASLLFFLALFQLAEYFVCGGLGASAATWSRIGFVAITVLPALGIHLLYVISKKPFSALTSTAYGMAIAWIAMFAFSESAFNGHVCAGNYVIFQLKPMLGGLYFAFYYFWLIIGGYLCVRFARKLPNKNRQSLILLGLGYASLLIPTTTANILDPASLDGVASIMCGFAIILAAIVTFGILPKLGSIRR